MHVPVLLQEVIDALRPSPGEIMCDGTVGDGGYAEAIIKRLGPAGIFLGVDLDGDAIARVQKKISGSDMRIVLRKGNYADVPEILREAHITTLHGFVLDLGISSDELESSGRGFSFKKDEPLDMRFDVNQKMTAEEAVNELSTEDLEMVLREYGEERHAKLLADAIVLLRKKQPIRTTTELVGIIEKTIGRFYGRQRIHPATRTFQALRIFVNNELQNLKTILMSLPEIMGSGGRVVIVSFHSLEDRLVKDAFRSLVKNNKASLLNKKPIGPGVEELRNNPRSRSAKLRAIQFL